MEQQPDGCRKRNNLIAHVRTILALGLVGRTRDNQGKRG
jgi:hypothetical protein